MNYTETKETQTPKRQTALSAPNSNVGRPSIEEKLAQVSAEIKEVKALADALLASQRKLADSQIEFDRLLTILERNNLK